MVLSAFIPKPHFITGVAAMSFVTSSEALPSNICPPVGSKRIADSSATPSGPGQRVGITCASVAKLHKPKLQQLTTKSNSSGSWFQPSLVFPDSFQTGALSPALRVASRVPASCNGSSLSPCFQDISHLKTRLFPLIQQLTEPAGFWVNAGLHGFGFTQRFNGAYSS